MQAWISHRRKILCNILCNLPIAEHCPLLLFFSWLSMVPTIPEKKVWPVSGRSRWKCEMCHWMTSKGAPTKLSVHTGTQESQPVLPKQIQALAPCPDRSNKEALPHLYNCTVFKLLVTVIQSPNLNSYTEYTEYAFLSLLLKRWNNYEYKWLLLPSCKKGIIYI